MTDSRQYIMAWWACQPFSGGRMSAARFHLEGVADFLDIMMLQIAQHSVHCKAGIPKPSTHDDIAVLRPTPARLSNSSRV